MSETTPAWLLRVANDIQFSISEHQAMEYIENPLLHYIPKTPASCKNIIYWRDKIVPVIDMNILFDHSGTINTQHLMVIAYQEKEHTPLQYVAYILASAPEKIIVNDDTAVELPEFFPEKLKPFVLSSFSYNHQPTSIFDIAQLNPASLEYNRE